MKLNQRRRKNSNKKDLVGSLSADKQPEETRFRRTSTYLSSCSRPEPGTRPAPSLFPSACRTSDSAPATPVRRTRITHESRRVCPHVSRRTGLLSPRPRDELTINPSHNLNQSFSITFFTRVCFSRRRRRMCGSSAGLEDLLLLLIGG